MENFEQVRITAAMAEDGKLTADALLPLAHREKQAAETRSLVIFLFTVGLVFITWPTLTERIGTIVNFVVNALFCFVGAYLLAGARRKREIASLTVATLEELRRCAPEKIRRDLVQKVFAEQLRRGAKAHIGLKRGAHPYTPQDKPGWKSVNYRSLVDPRATARKDRGDRASFLVAMLAFMGSGFLTLIPMRLLRIYVPMFRYMTRPKIVVCYFFVLLAALFLAWLIMRCFRASLTKIYAYGIDCERDSFYAVWNEAAHLHALSGKADTEQREGDTATGTSRRRHRGGRGKKKPAQATGEAQKPAEKTE